MDILSIPANSFPLQPSSFPHFAYPLLSLQSVVMMDGKLRGQIEVPPVFTSPVLDCYNETHTKAHNGTYGEDEQGKFGDRKFDTISPTQRIMHLR